MARAAARIIVLGALAGVLAACGSAPKKPPVVVRIEPRPVPQPQPVPNPVFKIGNPYQINGVWYYPREQPDYNETGIASWYGKETVGRYTANGEVFNPAAISAAHTTLPLPAIVRVTNLENGKSMAIRVNDRGPYVRGRIIDLSEHAADLLGFRGQGTARVRVSYLGRASLHGPGFATAEEETPPEIANAVPASPTKPVAMGVLPKVVGVKTAAERQVKELPKPVAQFAIAADAPIPDGSVMQVPVPASTVIFIQAGAFSTSSNAGTVASKLYSLGARVFPGVKDGQRLFRVRIGPFQDVGAADAVLAQVQALGQNDAQIVVEAQSG